MNIQIIGTKKCKNTQKAERFFRQRSIPFHFRNIGEKNLSRGELNNILQMFKIEDLLDTKGDQYRKRNLTFMVFNIEEEILNDSLILKTPVVRNGRLITVGYQPEIWKSWLNQ
jgi:arsenate reductase (glutaredoxin)